MISLFILWPLYIVGIQAFRPGWWRLLLPITGPVVVVAAILDIILNYTELSLIFLEFPKKRWNIDSWEYTFSMRLERYVRQPETWRGKLGTFIARKMLDKWDPKGIHIE